MISIQIYNIDALPQAANSFLKRIDHRKVFAFHGDMGAGKTTFIKALCESMGVKDVVNSPTFAIVNEYFSQKVGTIYHFDFYRIKNLQEAIDIGFDDYIFSGNYCFMEWCENISPLLPDEITEIKIDVQQNDCRLITVAELS